MWENRALHNLSPSKNGPRPKRRKCFGVEQSKVELRNEGVQRKTQPIIQQKVASAATAMDIHLLSSGHTSILMPCFLVLSAGKARECSKVPQKVWSTEQSAPGSRDIIA